MGGYHLHYYDPLIDYYRNISPPLLVVGHSLTITIYKGRIFWCDASDCFRSNAVDLNTQDWWGFLVICINWQ